MVRAVALGNPGLTIEELTGMSALAQYAAVVQMSPTQRAGLYGTATNRQLAKLAPAVSAMLSPIGDPGSRSSAAYKRYKSVVGAEIAATGENNTVASSSSTRDRSLTINSASGGVQANASGNYNYSQLEQLWIVNGGSTATAPMAAAIAMAESSGNPGATDDDGNGSVDRGLWQINSVHGALSTYDVNANAKAAIQISSGGSNWSPWTTYTSGAYLQYLKTGVVPSRYASTSTDAPITRPGGGTAGTPDTSGVQDLFTSYEQEVNANSAITPGQAGNPDFVSFWSNIPGVSQLGSLYNTTSTAVTDVNTFLSWIAWIFHPRNILRAVEFLTGIAIMFYGLHAEFVSSYGADNPVAQSTRRGAGLVGDVIGASAAGEVLRARRGRRSGRQAARAQERHRQRSAAHTSAFKAETAKQGTRSNERAARASKRRGDSIPF